MEALRTSGGPRRWSPRQIAQFQAIVDRLVRDIERIVRETTSAGRLLLDGRWSAQAVDAGPNGPRLPIRSMSPDHLGPDMTRTIGSLRSGGSGSLIITSVEGVREVLGHALALVAAERLRLVRFLDRGSIDDGIATHSKRESADDTSIVEENRGAAEAAVGDADLLDAVGGLTAGHLLAHSAARIAPAQGPPPKLTLTRPTPDANH